MPHSGHLACLHRGALVAEVWVLCKQGFPDPPTIEEPLAHSELQVPDFDQRASTKAFDAYVAQSAYLCSPFSIDVPLRTMEEHNAAVQLLADGGSHGVHLPLRFTTQRAREQLVVQAADISRLAIVPPGNPDDAGAYLSQVVMDLAILEMMRLLPPGIGDITVFAGLSSYVAAHVRASNVPQLTLTISHLCRLQTWARCAMPLGSAVWKTR